MKAEEGKEGGLWSEAAAVGADARVGTLRSVEMDGSRRGGEGTEEFLAQGCCMRMRNEAAAGRSGGHSACGQKVRVGPTGGHSISVSLRS